jgi:hypothetical protein
MTRTRFGLPRRLFTTRPQAPGLFPTARRGYDPDAVHRHLANLEAEIRRLQHRVNTVYAENDRIKQALRRWHRQHGPCYRNAHQYAIHPIGNSGRWPVNQRV